MSRSSPSERLYRLLLLAYPRRFRARYGRELMEAFRAQREEPEYRENAVRFWRELLRDWAGAVVAARGGTSGGRREAARKAATGPGRMGRITGWGTGMDGVRQDMVFAVRGLLRAPTFAVVAVVTLAVGIGSNAAIFGVVRSVLLQPLPYGDADRVVTIWSTWTGFPKSWVSLAEYRAYLTQSRSFEDLAIWSETDVTFTDPANPERVGGVAASENLTRVLGVEMTAGRFFTSAEALRADSLPTEVMVISDAAWARRWNRDPSIVGRTLEMNGRQREVIGVLPPGFRLPTQFGLTEPADVYFPMYVSRTMVTDFPEGGGSHGWHVAGRLRDGVTVEAAREDVRGVIDRVHAEFGAYPPDRAFDPLLLGAAEDVLGSIRPALMALLATVGFVLLIVCANVANLLLARSEDRASELAVRTALGAGRRRLVGQLLIESVLLAAVGGVLGVVLAYLGIDAFKALNPGNLPRVDEVRVDGVVLAFSLLVTLGTALAFGILPALRSTGTGLKHRMGTRGARGVGRSGWQGTLVAVETAAAVVLVVGAGLTVRTFGALTAIDPGFQSEQRLTLAVSLPTTRYPDAEAATGFWNEALRRIDELPGVTSVAAIRSLPLGSQIGDWGLDVEGYDESVNPRAAGDWQIASPGYFETMGIAIVAGRDIEPSDDASARLVAVVNESFVRRYMSGAEPLGRSFSMSGTAVTIVGVARDVTHNGLTAEIKPKFYIPIAQWGPVTDGIPTSLRLVVGTVAAPEALVASVRDVVGALDPSLAVAEIRTVDEVVLSAVAQPRFVMVLMSAFSFVALLLALGGVYGVVSYGVGKRRREIGVRIALGAVEDDVVGLVVRQGLAMVLTGLAAGLVLALLLSRYLESLLYEVSTTDPLTFASVVVGFGAVALLATWVPSRRAARVDPLTALRAE